MFTHACMHGWLQVAVGESQLLSTVHQHWGWLCLTKRALVAVLRLLTIYTAHNTRGACGSEVHVGSEVHAVCVGYNIELQACLV